MFRGCTFDEKLSGALLLPHHAGVGCVVSQGTVVDGEVAHVANALEDVPPQFTGTDFYFRP